jgi:predicted porin
MNKNIKLAVAGAVLALSASAANAGIIIPAGEWTLDINGNVNAFYINNNSKDNNLIEGGLSNQRNGGASGDTASSINTGLLPAWLGVTGKTRQNDLDTEFTISFQPSASSQTSLAGGNGANVPSEFRQAYLQFGDKSWGTIVIGKNIGQFGRDAILSDMTLLGVGSQGAVGTAGGTTTTLGRIGTGYMYADFNGQITYTTPNMGGFEATVGIDQPLSTNNLSITSTDLVGPQKNPAFVGVARYSFAADNVSGKVWLEGKGQKFYSGVDATAIDATAVGVGANLNAGNASLTAYYYDGNGAGTTAWGMDGVSAAGNSKRRSDGGYIQGTYVLPTKTKAGISWGQSNLDLAGGEVSANLVKSNEMTTVGLYHPLTKHLNLVGEYSKVTSQNHGNQENKSDIVSAGGILFF